MPFRLIIKFRPVEKCVIKNYSGKVAYDMYRELLSNSYFLENQESISTSPIAIEPFLMKFNSTVLEKDRNYSLVLKFIDDGLANELLERLVELDFITIKNTRFKVMGLKIERKGFGELLKDIYGREFIVRFKTPTILRRDNWRHNYILPNPELIIRDLVRKWNHFTYGRYRMNMDQVIREIRENLYISYYSLRTARVIIDGEEIIGFIGEMRLNINTDESLLALFLKPLLRFAEYSNIGTLTMYGLGVVRITFI